MSSKKEREAAGEFIGITWGLAQVLDQKKYRVFMNDIIKMIEE